MILKTDYDALVLVGLWNKSIFNPDWVSKFLLPKEKELNIEFPINVDGSSRVSSDKIRIFVIGNKLTFVPLNTSDETFEIIQGLAVKTVDYLPHTPVTAFGVNFLFETTVIDEALEQLLKVNDAESLLEYGATLKDSQHRHTFDLDRKTVNLTITKQNDSKTTFDFNWHFNISDITQFKEQIHLNPILNLRELAINIMKEVYNLEIKK